MDFIFDFNDYRMDGKEMISDVAEQMLGIDPLVKNIISYNYSTDIVKTNFKWPIDSSHPARERLIISVDHTHIRNSALRLENPIYSDSS